LEKNCTCIEELYVDIRILKWLEIYNFLKQASASFLIQTKQLPHSNWKGKKNRPIKKATSSKDRHNTCSVLVKKTEQIKDAANR
jgi:hypothetical protein